MYDDKIWNFFLLDSAFESLISPHNSYNIKWQLKRTVGSDLAGGRWKSGLEVVVHLTYFLCVVFLSRWFVSGAHGPAGLTNSNTFHSRAQNLWTTLVWKKRSAAGVFTFFGCCSSHLIWKDLEVNWWDQPVCAHQRRTNSKGKYVGDLTTSRHRQIY